MPDHAARRSEVFWQRRQGIDGRDTQFIPDGGDAGRAERRTRAVIDFSASSEAVAERLEGWSFQEPNGVWAIDDTSTVTWPGGDLRAGITLDLDVEPCLIAPYRTVQRLWVRLEHGAMSARLDVDRKGIFRVRLPLEATEKSGKLVFYHPDGIIPIESGGLADGRKLSLFFRAITLAAADPAPLTMEQTTELMARFESLGGTAQGCEFGLLQRQTGVEPLGLLRWAHMTADSLAEALEAGFAGVGTPAQTLLDKFTWPDGRQEYSAEDKRFVMRMHTWIDVADKPAEEVLALMCRRLKFLSGKLIEDLAAAQKIFVFKTGDRICDMSEIRRIHLAMRRYGPTTLLYVQLADPAHPPGSVRIAEDGLLIGYIDHFNLAADDSVRPLSRDIWSQICGRADSLRRLMHAEAA